MRVVAATFALLARKPVLTPSSVSTVIASHVIRSTYYIFSRFCDTFPAKTSSTVAVAAGDLNVDSTPPLKIVTFHHAWPPHSSAINCPKISPRHLLSLLYPLIGGIASSRPAVAPSTATAILLPPPLLYSRLLARRVVFVDVYVDLFDRRRGQSPLPCGQPRGGQPGVPHLHERFGSADPVLREAPGGQALELSLTDHRWNVRDTKGVCRDSQEAQRRYLRLCAASRLQIGLMN